MPETISLEVSRYSPERDAEPSFQRYDVPLRKD
jgi:succinate dehydrogenase/fumarate reductase-like Fe-S protein